MKKPIPGQRPKGIRRRVRLDGSEVFDAIVSVRGKPLHLGTRDTLEEAIGLRNAYFAHQANEGQPVPRDSGVLTLRQLGELCLDATGKDWDRDRWHARVELMADFIDWPVSDISDEDVQRWVDKMATTPLTHGKNKGELPGRDTVYSALSLLRRVFRWAKMPTRKYVTANPAEHVTIRNSTDVKLTRGRNLFDYLREDEAKILIDAPPSRIGLAPKTKFLVLMFSGARPSDVWRLSWERVDWKAETIQFTSTKTSKEEARDYLVHMLPQLKSALRAWWLKCGRPTSGLVFPSVDEDGNHNVYPRGYDAGWQDKRERRHNKWHVDGDPRHSKSVKIKTTKGYRTKLGIARDVPLYALRHTCACHLLLGTELFTGGRSWSREEIQAQLGHRDSKATEHYMRALGIVARKAVKESREALNLLKQG